MESGWHRSGGFDVGMKRMDCDLTQGDIMKKLLRFAFPIMVGNVLQQLYNVVDTLIVGRFLGRNALAAVGSSYTLMVFVTSIILGLCMGSSAFFSMQFGRRDRDRLENTCCGSLRGSWRLFCTTLWQTSCAHWAIR